MELEDRLRTVHSWPRVWWMAMWNVYFSGSLLVFVVLVVVVVEVAVVFVVVLFVDVDGGDESDLQQYCQIEDSVPLIFRRKESSSVSNSSA